MTTNTSSQKQKHPAAQAAPVLTAASQLASHGRGGAGNMVDAAQSPKLTPSELETPILKTPVVTTGRGGTGNMTKNNDPVETRLRQDVTAVPRRSSTGAQHAGRGGAGNVFKNSDEDVELMRKQSREHAIDDCPSPNAEPPGSKSKGWFFSGKRT